MSAVSGRNRKAASKRSGSKGKTITIKRKKRKRLRDTEKVSHSFGYALAVVLMLSAAAAWYTLSAHGDEVRRLLSETARLVSGFLSSTAAFLKALLFD